MSFNVDDFESIVDYNTVLDDFEGPLDLLLFMINHAQIKIEDIFVSQVTEQFLQYIEFMKSQPSRDVDKESEYLAMAAQIIYIKSKSILPVVEIMGEDFGGADDAEQELIEQLKQREFELIKKQEPKLKDLETYGYCFRDPDSKLIQPHVVYTDFNLDNLLKAFASLMMRNEGLQREKENIKEIPKDVYTVQEKVSFIRERLQTQTEFPFLSLFLTYSKNEVVTTFQALLEMLKHQIILIDQTINFGDIVIKINPEWDGKDLLSEQIDEYN